MDLKMEFKKGGNKMNKQEFVTTYGLCFDIIYMLEILSGKRLAL